jgi:hypothetical protein
MASLPVGSEFVNKLRTLSGVTQSEHDAGQDLTAALAEVGINVTPEGKARAREKLDAARSRHTPELRDARRRQVGLPPVQAA